LLCAVESTPVRKAPAAQAAACAPAWSKRMPSSRQASSCRPVRFGLPRGFWRGVPAQHALQDHRVIHLRIACAIEQGRNAALAELAQRGKIRIAGEFRHVALPEFGKALWPVTEPQPQPRTRRDLLHPIIEMSSRFLHAARPQPVDQNADAVRGFGGLIDALIWKVIGSSDAVYLAPYQGAASGARILQRLGVAIGTSFRSCGLRMRESGRTKIAQGVFVLVGGFHSVMVQAVALWRCALWTASKE
jgi:hypothetical protein